MMPKKRQISGIGCYSRLASRIALAAWPSAEVGHGVAPRGPVLAVDQRTHGIDTEARPEMLAQRHVGGGKADGAAALVAQLDGALDLPGMAQQLGRFAGP